MTKCIVVGFRVDQSGKKNVGATLVDLLKEKGHHVVAIAKRDKVIHKGGATLIHELGDPGDVTNALREFCAPDVVAHIAIPPMDMGKTSLAYIKFFRSLGMKIVISEKLGLAYHYRELLPELPFIGRSATVGGGTDMLESLKRRQLRGEDVTVYLVANGTANFGFSALENLQSFAGAVEAAKALGYAEPNSNDLVGILNGEIGGDYPAKATVLHNEVFAQKNGPFLIPGSGFNHEPIGFEVTPIRKEDLPRLTSPIHHFRYALTVSSIPYEQAYEVKSPGWLRAKMGRWTIEGGFHDLRSDSPISQWLRTIKGVNNGYLIHSPFSPDSGYHAGGPGAGTVTTALAMIRDMNRLTGDQ